MNEQQTAKLLEELAAYQEANRRLTNRIIEQNERNYLLTKILDKITGVTKTWTMK